MSDTQAVAIFRQVEGAIARWPEFAQAVGVRESIARIWGEGILSETKQGGPLRTDVHRFTAAP